MRTRVLPVVLGVQENSELKRLFGSGVRLDGAELERALDLMREPSIVDRGRAMAAEQVAVARDILERQLKPSVYRDCLAALIDDQIERDV